MLAQVAQDREMMLQMLGLPTMVWQFSGRSTNEPLLWMVVKRRKAWSNAAS